MRNNLEISNTHLVKMCIYAQVDLFLTKTENINGIQKNIIVEIKRASIKLTKDKEHSQIEKYKKSIL